MVLYFRNLKRPIGGGGAPFFRSERGVALCTEDVFVASPVNDDADSHWELRRGSPSDDLKAWVEAVFGDPHPDERNYEPGTVYKRIHWPMAFGRPVLDFDRTKFTQFLVALKILIEKLLAVFQTIEPTKGNQAVFGHIVREVLLLACMEVESSWSAVLRSNGYEKKSFTTKDYVKLREAMLLDSYRVSLRSYSGYPEFVPFDRWSPEKPTQSFGWYDAYNKAKHNREENLSCANLNHAICAVGAAVVLFYAQFGFKFARDVDPQVAPIRGVIKVEHDVWKYPQARYIPELVLTHSAMPGLTATREWRLVDYPF